MDNVHQSFVPEFTEEEIILSNKLLDTTHRKINQILNVFGPGGTLSFIGDKCPVIEIPNDDNSWTRITKLEHEDFPGELIINIDLPEYNAKRNGLVWIIEQRRGLVISKIANHIGKIGNFDFTPGFVATDIRTANEAKVSQDDIEMPADKLILEGLINFISTGTLVRPNYIY